MRVSRFCCDQPGWLEERLTGGGVVATVGAAGSGVGAWIRADGNGCITMPGWVVEGVLFGAGKSRRVPEYVRGCGLVIDWERVDSPRRWSKLPELELRGA